MASKPKNTQQRPLGPIVFDDGTLNIELVKAQMRGAILKGLEEAKRTGSDTILIKHEFDPYVEWGTKQKAR